MIEQVDREAANFLERWPGYNEQSWAERFAELDRRHTALAVRFYDAIRERFLQPQPLVKPES